MAIICKNGAEHTHQTVEESRKCWGRVFDPTPSAAVGVTDPPPATPEAVKTPVPYALQPKTSVPLAMLADTPDGYYAVRLDDSDPYRFLRINRPKQRKNVRTKHLGCIKVQTQHSETLKLAFLYRPLDANPDEPTELLFPFRTEIEKYIILAMVDSFGAGRAYARELRKCCICGKALTDVNSRKYGIGPECVKDHPEIIQYVDGLEED